MFWKSCAFGYLWDIVLRASDNTVWDVISQRKGETQPWLFACQVLNSASVLCVKIFKSQTKNKCHEAQWHQVVALPHDVLFWHWNLVKIAHFLRAVCYQVHIWVNNLNSWFSASQLQIHRVTPQPLICLHTLPESWRKMTNVRFINPTSLHELLSRCLRFKKTNHLFTHSSLRRAILTANEF